MSLFWMDSLKLLDFSSFIIFSDDHWSLYISFRQLFKLPLVVQCCDIICEWPLNHTPRLPMTKAAVKAMDTVTSFLASPSTRHQLPSPVSSMEVDITKFFVAGASKRDIHK